MTEKLPGGVNPADVLFKLAHARGIQAPEFEQVSENGPPHCKTFTWRCYFLDGQYNSIGNGKSKKDARNASAKSLIEQLDLSTLPKKPEKPQRNGGKRKTESKEMPREEGDKQGDEGAPVVKKSKKMKGLFSNAKAGWGDGQQNIVNPMFANGGGGGYSECEGYMGGVMGQMCGIGMAQTGMNIMRSMGTEQMGGIGMGQLEGMGIGQMGGMGMVQMGFSHSMVPMREGAFGNQQKRYVVEDRQVIYRHRMIYPNDEELDTILNLVNITERALKKVSDKFTESSNKDEKDRDVVGVARVADLAKGLLLTGDKEVQLVVMCRTKPTVSLLNKVAETLKPELQEQLEGKITFDIYLFPDESCFCVTSGEEGSSDVPFQIKVILTSTQHRNQELKRKVKEELEDDEKKVVGSQKVLNEDMKEDYEKKVEETQKVKEEYEEKEIIMNVAPTDLLPIDKCLDALAELRHAKWFTAMGTPLTSCVETIRILRDLAQREPAWSALGNWVTELLVERCLFSAPSVLTPSNCLLRVMEAVASGLFLPDGPSLRDPCERDEVDVANHLSDQEREDLTKYAMEAVRKMHFRKIHEVLGIERSVSLSASQRRKVKKESKVESAVKEENKKEAEVEDKIKAEEEVHEKSVTE